MLLRPFRINILQNQTATACSKAVEMAIIKNSKAEMIWARDKEAFY
jgi:hypothetical protein